MRFRSGERLRCSNPECRLEVIVLSPGSGKEPEASLTCHCGSPLKKTYEKPVVRKVRFTDGSDTGH